MTVQNQTPAGWYPDTQSGQLRYWDGTQWTNHYSPTQPATVQVNQQTLAVPRKVYKTSHGFHLLMSIITLGLWLPVWLIVGIYNSAKA